MYILYNLHLFIHFFQLPLNSFNFVRYHCVEVADTAVFNPESAVFEASSMVDSQQRSPHRDTYFVPIEQCAPRIPGWTKQRRAE